MARKKKVDYSTMSIEELKKAQKKNDTLMTKQASDQTELGKVVMRGYRNVNKRISEAIKANKEAEEKDNKERDEKLIKEADAEDKKAKAHEGKGPRREKIAKAYKESAKKKRESVSKKKEVARKDRPRIKQSFKNDDGTEMTDAQAIEDSDPITDIKRPDGTYMTTSELRAEKDKDTKLTPEMESDLKKGQKKLDNTQEKEIKKVKKEEKPKEDLVWGVPREKYERKQKENRDKTVDWYKRSLAISTDESKKDKDRKNALRDMADAKDKFAYNGGKEKDWDKIVNSASTTPTKVTETSEMAPNSNETPSGVSKEEIDNKEAENKANLEKPTTEEKPVDISKEAKLDAKPVKLNPVQESTTKITDAIENETAKGLLYDIKKKNAMTMGADSQGMDVDAYIQSLVSKDGKEVSIGALITQGIMASLVEFAIPASAIVDRSPLYKEMEKTISGDDELTAKEKAQLVLQLKKKNSDLKGKAELAQYKSQLIENRKAKLAKQKQADAITRLDIKQDDVMSRLQRKEELKLKGKVKSLEAKFKLSDQSDKSKREFKTKIEIYKQESRLNLQRARQAFDMKKAKLQAQTEGRESQIEYIKMAHTNTPGAGKVEGNILATSGQSYMSGLMPSIRDTYAKDPVAYSDRSLELNNEQTLLREELTNGFNASFGLGGLTEAEEALLLNPATNDVERLRIEGNRNPFSGKNSKVVSSNLNLMLKTAHEKNDASYLYFYDNYRKTITEMTKKYNNQMKTNTEQAYVTKQELKALIENTFKGLENVDTIIETLMPKSGFFTTGSLKEKEQQTETINHFRMIYGEAINSDTLTYYRGQNLFTKKGENKNLPIKTDMRGKAILNAVWTESTSDFLRTARRDKAVATKEATLRTQAYVTNIRYGVQ